jgi:phosphoglycolate phosphatase-like HAD superfamily hydrolase
MKLIIFDIDGTLANTLGIDDFCFREMLKILYKIEFSEVEWQKIKDETSGTDSGILQKSFLKQFHRNPTLNEIHIFKNGFYDLLKSKYLDNPSCFSEIPGAKAIINYLQANPEYVTAIATGSWHLSAELKLDAIGIDFNEIPLSCADNFTQRVDIIQNAIELSTKFYVFQDFEEITYIGDGVWDYISSNTLGINFLGIDFYKTGLLSNIGADKVYNNLNEVMLTLVMSYKL